MMSCQRVSFRACGAKAPLSGDSGDTPDKLYHAPQKHYLPEKIVPELFLKLPLPDLSFSELI